MAIASTSGNMGTTRANQRGLWIAIAIAVVAVIAIALMARRTDRTIPATTDSSTQTYQSTTTESAAPAGAAMGTVDANGAAVGTPADTTAPLNGVNGAQETQPADGTATEAQPINQ